MNHRPSLIHDLTIPILTALGLLSISTLLAWNASHNASMAEIELRDARSTLAIAQQKLNDADRQGEEIRHNTKVLLALAERGTVVGKNPADRERFLTETAARLHLNGVRAEFGNRQPLDKNATGEARWFSTALHLRLNPEHEEDLLHLLQALQQNAPALAQVHHCSLTPERGANTLVPDESGSVSFVADCDLEWLTIEAPTSR